MLQRITHTYTLSLTYSPSSHPHTHSLTTHTLSSHRHMNRYPLCGKNSSHCARNWMDPLLTLLCELFVTMTTVSTVMWTDQALLGHARMSSHFSDISCLKNIWAFKHSDPFKCSPGSHSVGNCSIGITSSCSLVAFLLSVNLLSVSMLPLLLGISNS